MNIQEQSESIANQRQCHNAKPPINHDIKHAEEAELNSQIAKFLDNGGKIKVISSFGSPSRHLTFKQGNDSTHTGDLV